jgi:hypothetical protein
MVQYLDKKHKDNMVNRGSWDLLRIVFMTTIPTFLLLFIGGAIIINGDEKYINNGFNLIYIGSFFLLIEILECGVIIFKKSIGCEGCVFNTEEKFLERYDITRKG